MSRLMHRWSVLLETRPRTNLFVLKSQQQDFLHQGEFGLLASLGALANVPGVEGDLVAIFAALVTRLGLGVLEVAGGVGAVDATVAALGLCGGSCTSGGGAAAPASCQARC